MREPPRSSCQVPCSYDFNVAATKYFAGLEEGEIPLSLLFSGSLFYEDQDARLQVAPISWTKEATFRLPVATWRELMDAYYPNIAWLQLRRDVFERLYRFKMENAIPTWEQALERFDGGAHAHMSGGLVKRIADAVLYEGYMLYPYRPSAVKNRQRFNFGVLYPEAYAAGRPRVHRPVLPHDRMPGGRQPGAVARGDGALPPARGAGCRPRCDGAAVAGRGGAGGTHGRRPLRALAGERGARSSASPPPPSRSNRRGHDAPAAPARRGDRAERAPGAAGVHRLKVRLSNHTPVADVHSPTRDELLLRSLVSAHADPGRDGGGEFISLLDPPAALAALAAGCENVGAWPVLAGEDGARDTMLASPIILYDYPEIAPESAGDLFDGTEIDEILSLRILTLTDEEKREMCAVGRARPAHAPAHRVAGGGADDEAARDAPRPRPLPEEALPMDRRWTTASGSSRDRGVRLSGDRVRLRPRAATSSTSRSPGGRDGGLDRAGLRGEIPRRRPGGRRSRAVSLGPRRPGHRFFFAPDEVERLEGGAGPAAAAPTRTILVAGIGNIFLGDDAFGVEVVAPPRQPRHARGRAPGGLRDPRASIWPTRWPKAPSARILIDACPRGEAPGTVYVVEPDLAALDDEEPTPSILDAHTMNPLHVLRLARSLGAGLRNVLLVGCEPATFGPEEGQIGLSEPVEAAVDRAVAVVESLLTSPTSP